MTIRNTKALVVRTDNDEIQMAIRVDDISAISVKDRTIIVTLTSGENLNICIVGSKNVYEVAKNFSEIVFGT